MYRKTSATVSGSMSVISTLFALDSSMPCPNIAAKTGLRAARIALCASNWRSTTLELEAPFTVELLLLKLPISSCKLHSGTVIG
ncbi:unnamed protein product [Schistosoma mattheei]|uniref:Uncharacterized protein n=1 Tax=Schistosoma mattheei TaxID=31246 RepID=A0A183PVB3_9TREM|nr:unnamed protein product [Schistosoma mattheei]